MKQEEEKKKQFFFSFPSTFYLWLLRNKRKSNDLLSLSFDRKPRKNILKKMAKKAKVIRRSEKPKNLIFSPFSLSEEFYPFF